MKTVLSLICILLFMTGLASANGDLRVGKVFIDANTYIAIDGSGNLVLKDANNAQERPLTSLSGGGSPAWGNITGTLSSQTDLQSTLDGKAATHTHPYSGDTHNHDGSYAPTHGHPYSSDTHNHSGTYEPANANIQTHVGSAHAQNTTCSGTNKMSAYNSTTGAFTCSTDQTGAGGEAFPVGSVFISVVSTNPATLLGYGTWSAFATGRVLIGIDAGQAEFDTVEETGGAKTHTHADHTGVMNHTHTVGVTDPGHTHTTQRYPTATGGSTGFTIDTSMSGTQTDNTLTTKSGTTGITANTQNPAGGVSALSHDSPSHLQPYIVVYMWKRTI